MRQHGFARSGPEIPGKMDGMDKSVTGDCSPKTSEKPFGAISRTYRRSFVWRKRFGAKQYHHEVGVRTLRSPPVLRAKSKGRKRSVNRQIGRASCRERV